MKGKLLVVFHSEHGYVKRYVDILGNALGCDAVPFGKLKGDMLAGYDKILFISSVKNGEINGIKKFSDYYDAIYKKLIVCAIGVCPFKNYLPQRIKDSSVSVAYEKFIPVFYAQGGFDINELSRFEKFSVALRLRQIKMSPVLSDEDAFFMNAADKPVDEVKIENIQPLIDYLEGREVDEKLYSPPEITDPEEEKAFFAALEKEINAPLNKKRALKKKLKKTPAKRAPEKNEEEPEPQQAAAASEEKEPAEPVAEEDAETAAEAEEQA